MQKYALGTEIENCTTFPSLYRYSRHSPNLVSQILTKLTKHHDQLLAKKAEKESASQGVRDTVETEENANERTRKLSSTTRDLAKTLNHIFYTENAIREIKTLRKVTFNDTANEKSQNYLPPEMSAMPAKSILKPFKKPLTHEEDIIEKKPTNLSTPLHNNDAQNTDVAPLGYSAACCLWLKSLCLKPRNTLAPLLFSKKGYRPLDNKKNDATPQEAKHTPDQARRDPHVQC